MTAYLSQTLPHSLTSPQPRLKQAMAFSTTGNLLVSIYLTSSLLPTAIPSRLLQVLHFVFVVSSWWASIILQLVARDRMSKRKCRWKSAKEGVCGVR